MFRKHRCRTTLSSYVSCIIFISWMSHQSKFLSVIQALKTAPICQDVAVVIIIIYNAVTYINKSRLLNICGDNVYSQRYLVTVSFSPMRSSDEEFLVDAVLLVCVHIYIYIYISLKSKKKFCLYSSIKILSNFLLLSVLVWGWNCWNNLPKLSWALFDLFSPSSEVACMQKKCSRFVVVFSNDFWKFL